MDRRGSQSRRESRGKRRPEAETTQGMPQHSQPGSNRRCRARKRARAGRRFARRAPWATDERQRLSSGAQQFAARGAPAHATNFSQEWTTRRRVSRIVAATRVAVAPSSRPATCDNPSVIVRARSMRPPRRRGARVVAPAECLCTATHRRRRSGGVCASHIAGRIAGGTARWRRRSSSEQSPRPVVNAHLVLLQQLRRRRQTLDTM